MRKPRLKLAIKYSRTPAVKGIRESWEQPCESSSLLCHFVPSSCSLVATDVKRTADYFRCRRSVRVRSDKLVVSLAIQALRTSISTVEPTHPEARSRSASADAR